MTRSGGDIGGTRTSRRRFLSGAATLAAGLAIPADRLPWALPGAAQAQPRETASIRAITPWRGGLVALVAAHEGMALQRVTVSTSRELVLGEMLVIDLPGSFITTGLAADERDLYITGAFEVDDGLAAGSPPAAEVDAMHAHAWSLTALEQLVPQVRRAAGYARVTVRLTTESVLPDGLATGDHSWLSAVAGRGPRHALLATGGPTTAEATYGDTVHLLQQSRSARDGWDQHLLAVELGEGASMAMAEPSPHRPPFTFVSGASPTTDVYRGPTLVEEGLPGTVTGTAVAIDSVTVVVATDDEEAHDEPRLWSVGDRGVSEVGRRRRQAIDGHPFTIAGPGLGPGELIVRRRDGSYAAAAA